MLVPDINDGSTFNIYIINSYRLKIDFKFKFWGFGQQKMILSTAMYHFVKQLTMAEEDVNKR